tara:strand:+ start:2650 stop:2877 length:228 start_codon:yes stop_codon:yes gene_type:complete
MKARILSKKITQQILRNLKRNGIEVEKVDEGFYKCYDYTLNDNYEVVKEPVFYAMIGRKDYLCRFNPDYFNEESS